MMNIHNLNLIIRILLHANTFYFQFIIEPLLILNYHQFLKYRGIYLNFQNLILGQLSFANCV